MNDEMTREQWEKLVLAWWDGNEMDDYKDDPPPEATWDGYELIRDFVAIVKNEQNC